MRCYSISWFLVSLCCGFWCGVWGDLTFVVDLVSMVLSLGLVVCRFVVGSLVGLFILLPV